MLTERWAGVSLSAMPLEPTESEIEKKLNHVSLAALKLLRRHPEGLDIRQIRSMIEVGGDQEWLNKRIRELRKYYKILGEHQGDRFVYTFKGRKPKPAHDTGAISGKLRAEILNLAKGRCQMCGKTVHDDGIKLQIDHKIPQTWGGRTVADNLWAICMPCNNGKRDHFESFDSAEMAKILEYETVHERIAQLLKLHLGEPVESSLIEFVANATERQEDWQKRLRDLRYPVIGLKISSSRYKTPEGHWRSTYSLHNWRDLPPDHRKLIQAWDKPTKRAEIKRQLGIE